MEFLCKNNIPFVIRLKEDMQIRQHVGILTESPGLYDGLSAERNLDFYANMYEVENIPGQVERGGWCHCGRLGRDRVLQLVQEVAYAGLRQARAGS